MSKVCIKCAKHKPDSEFYAGRNDCKPCKRAANAVYRNGRGKERERLRRYKYIEQNPKKRWAHLQVHNALRTGNLTRPNKCKSCNKQTHKLHAHHDDYDRPLNVRWLCHYCHMRWHGQHGEADNATTPIPTSAFKPDPDWDD
jgi:hypothetical protein